MAKVHMETSNLVKQKVLVIGYGAAGSKVAVYAAKNALYDVTVVTPFEYMEISLCMTKVVATGPEEHNKVIYDLLREPNVTYIIDTVASLTNNVAVLTSGTNVPFDVCVVATGQNIPLFYPNPQTERTMEARKNGIKKVYEDVQKARSIVVGGAGPVGVEVAADIKLRFKDKNVTVVNHQDEVLAMMHPNFRSIASNQLDKMHVNVIPHDRVVLYENNLIRLESNKEIPCDLYIPAFAKGGNAEFLPAGSKDVRGYAVVDDSLVVQGLNHVLAVGDCSNYDRVKTYLKIDDQMPVLKHNLDAILAKKPLKHHVKGVSFQGKIDGPMMVALGHGLPDGYGVGPSMPGCMGVCCFICCCGTPSGHRVSNIKSDFNLTIKPRLGKGISK